MVAIQTHIHTPFPHLFIIDDIWCPLIALHCIIFILPFVRIKVTEIYFLTPIVLHLLDDMKRISILVIDSSTRRTSKETIIGIHTLFTNPECGPTAIVARRIGFTTTQMRTIDIIHWGSFRGKSIYNNRRIVNRNTTAIGTILIQILKCRICKLRLCHCRKRQKTER